MTGKILFSNMDVSELEAIDAFSALKQEISRHLLIDAERLHLPCDHPRVITLVLEHFYRLAPTQNLCLTLTVELLAKAAQESRQ